MFGRQDQRTSTVRSGITLRSMVGKVAWVGLLFIHAPLLIGILGRLFSAPSVGDLLRVAIVGLSIAFFWLKIVDVPWLRLGGGWRSWGVASICVLLLHADVLRRTHAVALDTPPDAVLFIMGAATLATVTAVLRLVIRRVDAARMRRVRCAAHDVFRLLLSRALRAFMPPRFLLLVRSCAVDRGPPR